MIDIFEKLQDAQQAMDNLKDKMENTYIDAEAEGGLVKIKVSATKKLINITISPELIKGGDTEAIEDLLVTAVNRAFDKAEELYNREMQQAAQGILPNLPGLF